MYKIEKNATGFFLTFGGMMTKDELDRWYRASKEALFGQLPPFGVIVDMRTLSPLPEDAHEVMVRGQAMYRKHGMERSCVILEDAITTIQFMRLARRSGIYAYERYVDASAHEDWQERAINWVTRSVEPGE
jgi:hypothetical protein